MKLVTNNQWSGCGMKPFVLTKNGSTNTFAIKEGPLAFFQKLRARVLFYKDLFIYWQRTT